MVLLVGTWRHTECFIWSKQNLFLWLQKNSSMYFFRLLIQPIYTNCGIAVKDYMGDRERNELTFTMGALVTNVQNKSAEWAIGDHRGDKQKFFRPDHVQLLTRDELAYINDLVS